MTTEERLAVLEGRTDEHAAANAALRDDLRQGLADVRAEIADVRADMRTEMRAVHTRIDALNARFDALQTQVNSRFDRLLYTMLGLFVAQAGVILTIVLRT